MGADNKAKVLRDAEKFVLQGRIPQAIGEYLKIIRNDANDVLILNTIGDLYLRQRRISEANKYFTQVAENYTRNHFLLKAIAVYKKILSADPQNIEINQILASLFARQGLNVDARSQYKRLVDLCTKQGKVSELRDAYERLAELEANNPAIHLKIAEMYLTEGTQEKAQSALANAGRAQVKAGNLSAAMESFRRALEINPTDKEVLRNFFDAAIQKKDPSGSIEVLKRACDLAPGDFELEVMLGNAFLAAGDLEQAGREFLKVLAQEEERYTLFFALHQAFVGAKDLDMAAASLDPIIPILIRKRETERAVEAHDLALKADPSHPLTLIRLAEIFSSTTDTFRYLDALDRLAASYLERQNPKSALESLEKILSLQPESEKHRELHRKAFSEAFPDSEYAPPAVLQTVLGGALPVDIAGSEAGAAGGAAGPLVEVDLLLNYGMREKAIELLRSIESRDPSDKEVRARLLDLYTQDKRVDLAAEQYLLLAACCHNAGDRDTARRMIAEAKRLAPQLMDDEFDLAVFALKRGLRLKDLPLDVEEPGRKEAGGLEVDLSGDLSEIFFKGDTAPLTPSLEQSGPDAAQRLPDDYPPAIQSPIATFKDQLQEVDFYLQLGFLDEALIKLDEIAREHPGDPDVDSRYHQLDGYTKAAASIAQADTDGQIVIEPVEEPPGAESEAITGAALVDLDFQERDEIPQAPESLKPPELHDLIEHIQPDESPAGREKPQMKPAVPPSQVAESHEDSVTAMFADLMNEVNALTDQEIAQEDFETHFSLGIAYREMDLVEDAIKEFLAAVKELDPNRSPKEVVQCCGMLSTCFLDKQMPRSAIRWCQTGLSVRQISQHEAVALRYDLGIAHLQSGDTEKALECFSAIFGVDSTYRDVAQRIDDLKRGPSQHAP